MTALRLRTASTTHAGDRAENQDRAAILADGHVCLVADGMGGEAGGALASLLIVESVAAAVEARKLDPTLGLPHLEGALHEAASQANAAIARGAAERPELMGMGSTLTLLGITHGEACFVHVGDSRLYHWREGRTCQLTRDDTSAQEMVESGQLAPEDAARHPASSLLVRYLGTTRSLCPSTGRQPLLPGDRLLMSTDGLHGAIATQQLDDLLGVDAPPEKIAQRLIATARELQVGDLDNLTALVIEVS